MSAPLQPGRRHLSTYILPSLSREEELKHLRLQETLLLSGMGGVLPEQSDSTAFKQILDIGCNTGDWLLEMALNVPSATSLVGINPSQQMIKYARRRAEARQVSNRVSFRIMQSLSSLDFPDSSFDLVNLHFGQSYLRTWDWSPFLHEVQRVLQPDGMVRITEMNIFEGPGPVLSRYGQFVEDTLYHAGHRFVPANESCEQALTALLQRYEFQDIHTRCYRLTYHAGTKEGEMIAQKIAYGYRHMSSFLQKWTRLPYDYGKQYHQLLQEMQSPDFIAIWPLLTIWGRKHTEIKVS